MSEERKMEFEPQRDDQFEDEIELMDYLKVLWKWKYLILVGTLVCVIGAAVVSLNMTKVYGINTIVQPGLLKATDDGKTLYIDSATNIKALIDTRAFNGQVTKNLKLSDKAQAPDTADFKVTIPKGSHALDILYETPVVDAGLQIVNNLNDALLARYGKLIEQYKNQYDMDIFSKKAELSRLEELVNGKRNAIHTTEAGYKSAIEQNANTISSLNAQMEGGKNQIKSLEQKMIDLESEIGRITKNTNLLSEDRNRYMSSSKSRDNILASLIYSNTIQQNISYLNTLRNDMNDAREQIYIKRAYIKELEGDIKDLMAEKEELKSNTKIEIEDLKSNIRDLETDKKYKLEEIENLKFKKNSIQNIQIIKPPKASPSPIKPKTRLNVMLAGVVGLFLTVFLAFFVEYISKYRSREDER